MKTVKIEVEVDASSLSVTYQVITNILKAIEDYDVVKVVSVEESDKPVSANFFPGHTSGCRMTRDGKLAPCTCGPVPR